MLSRSKLPAALLAALLIPAARAEDAKPITVESLLGKLTDPSWLAEPPKAGERSFQFSSYDRATRLVDGKIVEPFANNDRGHYLRVEGEGDRREWVLADATGPGYVSRIWSANPDGELRIYVDGAAEPALAADFAAITAGQVEPFSAPFGHDASRGRNLYFPFPFAKSIKITTTKGDQYYQVNVTTFAPGTPVESYSPAVLERANRPDPAAFPLVITKYSPIPDGAIARARRELSASRLNRHISSSKDNGDLIRLEAGSSQAVVRGDGKPGLITALRCATDAEVVDRTLLTITFDDADEPQVAAPLGDFFGSGPGVDAFRTRLLEAARSRGPGDKEFASMASFWSMPYRRSARVTLTNRSDRAAYYRVTIDGRDDPAAAGMLTFHARWLQRDDVQTLKGAGTLDWPALRVSGGPGRFVGLQCSLYNPVTAWWGEGDEKVYVDGEPFPSTFGTGTEDYFGYAWGDPSPFMSPFHAQARCDGPGTKGNTSLLRLQTLDAIPFAESLAFDLELWHWEAVKVQFATLAYVYAAPGAKVEPAGVPDLSRRIIHPRPPIHREPGAIEAESLRVRGKTAGEVPNQDMAPFGDAWSGARQLFWIVREPGAKLDLELPVATGGKYAVSAGFTKAGDYGTVQFMLDGAPLGMPVDLYAPNVVHSGSVFLGVADLAAGPNALGIQVVGKDEKSRSHLVGVDWIKLVPAAAGDQGGGTARPRR